MGAVRGALGEAILAALPIALVYFSGWAYLTSYLGEFGIDATQVDVTLTTVLVYSFVPLRSVFVLILILLIATIGLIAFIIEARSDATNEKRAKTVASFLVFISLPVLAVLLFAIKASAASAAKEMAHNVWQGSKSQSVMMLGGAKNDADAMALYDSCRQGRRLRQIIGMPNQMFLLCRSSVDPCNRGTLFAVSNDGRIVYFADKVREDVDDVKAVCTG